MQTEESIAVTENYMYVMPNKMVKSTDDMRTWERSEAYYEYVGFLYTLNDCIRGRSNEEGSADASPEINKFCGLLDIIDGWIDNIRPIQQSQILGSQSFGEWYSKLRHEAIKLLQSVLPESSFRAVPEIMVYLIEGFGDPTTVDYGTGHELSFLMFLCALFKIGFLKPSDAAAVACKVFVRYLDIVRKLQTTYNMNSVGSLGVWSLDDYQFVPFIWGSSQLIGNNQLDPASFLKEHLVHKTASEYMFMGCIDYINTTKTGPFAEHANQLWSVSGVSTWSKINTGLIRMYRTEILSDFAIIQHVYFGSIFTLQAVEQGSSVRRQRVSVPNIHKLATNVEFSEVFENRGTTSFDFRFKPATVDLSNPKEELGRPSREKRSADVVLTNDERASRDRKSAEVRGSRDDKADRLSRASREERADRSTRASKDRKSADLAKVSKEERSERLSRVKKDRTSSDFVKVSKDKRTLNALAKTSKGRTNDLSRISESVRTAKLSKTSGDERAAVLARASKDKKADGLARTSEDETTDDSTKAKRDESVAELTKTTPAEQADARINMDKGTDNITTSSRDNGAADLTVANISVDKTTDNVTRTNRDEITDLTTASADEPVDNSVSIDKDTETRASRDERTADLTAASTDERAEIRINMDRSTRNEDIVLFRTDREEQRATKNAIDVATVTKRVTLDIASTVV